MTGGELRGRRLSAVPRGVRPTSDRVRETLFSALGDPAGVRVLDLFAGTGMLGIEALSRGAKTAVFVDRSARSLQAVRANLEALGLSARARVRQGPAHRQLRSLGGQAMRFDLVFLDPPYDSGELEVALRGLCEHALLESTATVVAESATRHSWAAVEGYRVLAERSYGDTRITRLVPEIVRT